MKKRRTFIIIAMLIGVLLLGIGYAVISNVTLRIEGTAAASANAENFKVKFTGTPTKSDETKVTEAIIVDELNAKIKVEGLTAKGDKATATYTVLNNSEDLTANLGATITNNNEEYFSVTKELAASSITAGNTTTITVTVELLKTPIDADVTAQIGVEVAAEPVQPQP